MPNSFPKEDIIITQTPSRVLRINQNDTDLAIHESHDHNSPWYFVTPEEMALIMLCVSGRFVERYNTEVERLNS